VRVLSRLFRRLFLEGVATLHKTGRLAFFGDLALLADQGTFDAVLTRARRTEWVVYAKRPFAGPQVVLAYLARYTHRVAISNSRLIALDHAGITFKWKDYRIKGRDRLKTMTLDAAELRKRRGLVERELWRFEGRGQIAGAACRQRRRHPYAANPYRQSGQRRRAKRERKPRDRKIEINLEVGELPLWQSLGLA
jgi:Putative transposase